jgi:hypothetical protein
MQRKTSSSQKKKERKRKTSSSQLQIPLASSGMVWPLQVQLKTGVTPWPGVIVYVVVNQVYKNKVLLVLDKFVLIVFKK